MRVTVLLGGPSAEREISLLSGSAVVDALRAGGHEVFASDISPASLSALDRSCDVVFPVLHGAFGESGELQEILEARNIPFVGSGSVASQLGMDKVATKRVWELAGLPTPKWEIVKLGGEQRMPAPCVVKPIASGSSLDVFICPDDNTAREAIAKVTKAHGEALVEKQVVGVELTVGILEEKPLSPIRISTSRQFFDYKAKYVGDDARHDFDVGLPKALVHEIQNLAERAHLAVGCRDLSRVDFMFDAAERKPYLLEINTMPGFTAKSLLPEAAAHDGIDFVHLVDRLVKRAHARRDEKSRSTAA